MIKLGGELGVAVAATVLEVRERSQCRGVGGSGSAAGRRATQCVVVAQTLPRVEGDEGVQAQGGGGGGGGGGRARGEQCVQLQSQGTLQRQWRERRYG